MHNLIGLLALSLLSVTVPNDTQYQFGVDLQYQYRYTQVFESFETGHTGYYNLDTFLTFYTHLDYNSTSDYQFTYQGFKGTIYIYDSTEHTASDFLYTSEESDYVEVDFTINEFTTFEVSTNLTTDDGSYDYNIDIHFPSGVSSCSISVPSYVFNADFIFDTSVQIIWSPIINYDIPNIVDGNSFNVGINEGYEQGFADGTQAGRQQGFADGVRHAQEQDQTALTIFEGIVTVALVPINFFLAIFNFEIFGINISGFVSALLTVSIIIIIVRFMTGQKQDD